MIDRDHDLSIVRQAKVLKLARSTVYYEPVASASFGRGPCLDASGAMAESG
ncbi:hypothetical protein ACVIHA_004495 [Bradyrhizobium liaoningense]